MPAPEPPGLADPPAKKMDEGPPRLARALVTPATDHPPGAHEVPEVESGLCRAGQTDWVPAGQLFGAGHEG